MDVTIRLAKEGDFSAYLDLMQKTYQASFVNNELGLTKDMFVSQYFHTPTALKFFTEMMNVNDKQKCWLAFIGDELVGSITMTNKENEYMLGGFYVATKHQGMGIGKKLWNLAQDYAERKDITLGVYTHNAKTIELYKKWGFVIDATKEIEVGHWEDWPEGVTIKTLYMRRSDQKSKNDL